MKRDAPEDELVPLNFGLGVNNIDDESELPEGSVREAVNVDISRTGWPRRRKGYNRVMDLVNGHSIYSNDYLALIANNGFLCQLDLNVNNIIPIIEIEDPVHYVDVLGTTYFTDDKINGRILKDGSYLPVWTPAPNGLPTLTQQSAGSLQPGFRQVALTFVGQNGEESGTDIGSVINLSTNAGITITDIPQSMDASFIRIYATTAGGEIFYLQDQIPMGITSYALKTHKLGKQLETQFAEEIMPGQAMCHHYGRLYVAVGEYIYYSESLRPGLTRLMDNYFPPVGGRVKMIMSNSAGIFVVADKTHFIMGRDPKEMSVEGVYPYSGVPGTHVQVPMKSLGFEGSDDVPVWFSDQGLVAGVGEGQVVPFTDSRIAVSTFGQGASIYRENDGIRSVVTAVQSMEQPNKLKTSDSISFEVRRNGITIPP